MTASDSTPEDSESTDEALVARMARGDRAALGELYQRHAPRLRMVIGKMVRDPALTADLTQDVFLEAWRKCDQYDAARGAVSSWLTVRARSRTLDRIRSAAHQREVAPPGEIPDEPQHDQAFDVIHLPEALTHGSSAERDVLELGYFEDLTCAEVAERLNIPVGTVKSRTRSGLSKLRQFWKERDE